MVREGAGRGGAWPSNKYPNDRHRVHACFLFLFFFVFVFLVVSFVDSELQSEKNLRKACGGTGTCSDSASESPAGEASSSPMHGWPVAFQQKKRITQVIPRSTNDGFFFFGEKQFAVEATGKKKETGQLSPKDFQKRQRQTRHRCSTSVYSSRKPNCLPLKKKQTTNKGTFRRQSSPRTDPNRVTAKVSLSLHNPLQSTVEFLQFFFF